ncbi:MAG: NAD-dependent epimerase/dehydratase family protein [Rhodobacteraceae bacterium]|nr:NAD-dependent epimerase/dehydratase family protein [Paracoccaceae bacterium]
METSGLDGFSGRRVLVTGASGFIGRRVVPALRAAGAKVTVLSRSRSGSALADAVDSVAGDLGRRGDVDRALAGQDVLVHLAYDVRATAAQNLADFETLLAAAGAAHLARVVHASSIVVYDGWPGADLDESCPMIRPGGSPYRRAKIAMEQRLIASGLPVTILQPTLVYGPGSTLWTDTFAEWLAAGAVVLPEPEGRCNAVYVDDVAQALVRAAAQDGSGQARFIISGVSPVSWSDLLTGYAGILGRGSIRHEAMAALAARVGPAPDPETAIPDAPSKAARLSALARGVLGRERVEGLVHAVKRRMAPQGDHYPDRFLLDLFAARGVCRIDRAREMLGYAPAFGLAEGLAATAPYLAQRYGAA